VLDVFGSAGAARALLRLARGAPNRIFDS